MRRVLTLLLMTAQVFALGWGSLAAERPFACGALWRVAAAPSGTTASQPREIRARSAYAVAAQNLFWPRTGSVRTSPGGRRVERLVSVHLVTRPGWVPAAPCVLRI